MLFVRVALVGTLVLAGCVDVDGGGGGDGDEPVDATRDTGKRDGLFVGDDSPEQFGALRVANELGEGQLVSDAHLGKRAAAAIVRFRAGRDGREGTLDDWRFESLDELDAVPYVGDPSIEKLAEYAQVRGWIPSPPALVSTSPAPGTEGFDRCGTLELRFSQPIDPESIDVHTDALRVTVEGDRVLARGFNLPGPKSLSVRSARAVGGGPPMKDWATLQVRVADTGSPSLVRPWPEGAGARVDASVGVDICGVADPSSVTIRLLDGAEEVPLAPQTSNSAAVWRRPLAPLAAGRAYDVVASVAAGPERRWRFTTAAKAFHRESLSVSSQTVLDAADDGTVVAYTPGGRVSVGRLGGTFAVVPGPDWSSVERAFALPGGGVRGVWEDDSTVWTGTFAPSGTTSAQVAVGFVMDAFRNGWIVMEQEKGLTLATPGEVGIRTELVKGGIWPVVEEVHLDLAPQGTVWLTWRDRDSDDAFVSRRTASGWTHHALRNQTYEHPQVALDGAGAFHVLTDADIDGVVSWRIDDSSKDGPMRRLGGGSLDNHFPRFVPDGRGNLLAIWTTAVGSWVRWWQGDLGAWGAREGVAKISDVAAGPDGTIYLLADGGVWRGGLGRSWERIADAPESRIAVLAGTVVVYGYQGLFVPDR